MRYVMTYRAVQEFLPLAQQHGQAHVVRLHEFRDRGLLLRSGRRTSR